MAPRYLVDTDLLIDFLRGNTRAVSFVKANAHRMEISAIAVAELFAGVRRDQDLAEIDAFCSLFPVHAVDADVAKEAGLLKMRYSKSHGVGLADAVVAATAMRLGLELKTLNVKHYPMFAGLAPAYRKTR